MVEAGYDEAADEGAIRKAMTQEFDYILSGSLKVKIDDQVHHGRGRLSILRDASQAWNGSTNGKPCVFLAVVIRDQEGRMG